MRIPLHFAGRQIAKVNTTLLNWLGYKRTDLVGRRKFCDLLTVGGRLYHETHFAPLLRMQGEISGIALELEAADGSRLPVLVTSTVKTDSDGQPLLIRTTIFDARDRRAYEHELLRTRQEAERERERLQQLATTLQKTLLPPALENVPGLDVAAYYHIASIDEVGGDFYDLFPLAAGTWGLFLGDVCGKAPRRRPSHPWPATPCEPQPSTTPTRPRFSATSTPSSTTSTTAPTPGSAPSSSACSPPTATRAASVSPSPAAAIPRPCCSVRTAPLTTCHPRRPAHRRLARRRHRHHHLPSRSR